MSTRGTDFLDKWFLANVPNTVGADVISVAELTQKLFADAKALGIGSVEIEEDVGSAIEEDIGSAYEAILDAGTRACGAAKGQIRKARRGGVPCFSLWESVALLKTGLRRGQRILEFMNN